MNIQVSIRISIRIGCFDLLAVQGTLKSILQHHSSKPSIIPCSLPVYFNSPIIAKLCLCFWIYSLDGYRFSSKVLAPFFFFFMAAVTICSDFGARKNTVYHCFHFPPCFPYLTWSDGTRYHDCHFFNVEVWARFFALFFLFISRLFSYSSLSVIYVVSSVYMRSLIFLQAILILVWASSSLAFHTMCSEYKLNKPHNNIQPWCTPFPIWN